MPRVVQALVAGALLIHGAVAVPPADAESRPAMQDDGDAAEALADSELRETEFREGDQMMDNSADMAEYNAADMAGQRGNPIPDMPMPPPPMDDDPMPPPSPMGMMPPMDDFSILPPMDDPAAKVEEKLRRLEDMMKVMENAVFPNCKDKPTQQTCHLSAGKCMWRLRELKPANHTDGKDGKGKGKHGKDAKKEDKKNDGDKETKEGDKKKKKKNGFFNKMMGGAKKMVGGAMGRAKQMMGGAMGAASGAMKGLQRFGGQMFGPKGPGPMAQGPPPVLIGECVDVPKAEPGKGKDGKGKHGKHGKAVAADMEKMLKNKTKSRSI